MTIETFCLGSLDTNAYVISVRNEPECWIFDCPDTPDRLLTALRSRGAKPQAVYLTHAHGDHMAGLNAFRAAFPGTPVYQHPLEALWLADPHLNLSSWLNPPATADPAEGFVESGAVLNLGPWRVRVLHLPGHSPGSVAFWFEDEDEVISGDVLFRSGVGRWDFPGCDRDQLRSSLATLCELPDSVRVRPGHGGSTTIGKEKASNPYLRSDELWE